MCFNLFHLLLYLAQTICTCMFGVKDVLVFHMLEKKKLNTQRQKRTSMHAVAVAGLVCDAAAVNSS